LLSASEETSTSHAVAQIEGDTAIETIDSLAKPDKTITESYRAEEETAGENGKGKSKLYANYVAITTPIRHVNRLVSLSNVSYLFGNYIETVSSLGTKIRDALKTQNDNAIETTRLLVHTGLKSSADLVVHIASSTKQFVISCHLHTVEAVCLSVETGKILAKSGMFITLAYTPMYIKDRVSSSICMGRGIMNTSIEYANSTNSRASEIGHKFAGSIKNSIRPYSKALYEISWDIVEFCFVYFLSVMAGLLKVFRDLLAAFRIGFGAIFIISEDTPILRSFDRALLIAYMVTALSYIEAQSVLAVDGFLRGLVVRCVGIIVSVVEQPVKEFVNDLKSLNLFQPEPIESLEVYLQDPLKPTLTSIPYEILLTHLIPLLDTESIYRLFYTCKLFHLMIGYPTESSYSRWNLEQSYIPSISMPCSNWPEETPLLTLLRRGIPERWIKCLGYIFSQPDIPINASLSFEFQHLKHFARIVVGYTQRDELFQHSECPISISIKQGSDILTRIVKCEDCHEMTAEWLWGFRVALCPECLINRTIR
jgi:hypothetical protein